MAAGITAAEKAESEAAAYVVASWSEHQARNGSVGDGSSKEQLKAEAVHHAIGRRVDDAAPAQHGRLHVPRDHHACQQCAMEHVQVSCKALGRLQQL